ncbi:MAG: poly(3-hydroxybutyrate) depolymerase, partial [Burkholderiales bacterium]|nr:poly(3-hydroxybutyrate) depolymerase [Burkholderiales bacterium]
MDLPDKLAKSQDLATKVATLFQKRAQVAQDAFAAELRRAWSAPAVAALLADPGSGARLGSDWYGYAVDAAQRSILFWDTMRERGNAFVEHNREGL